MIRTIQFFVPGLPQPKQYKQTRFGTVYTKGAVVQWEKSVAQSAEIAGGAGYQKFFGQVSLELHFYLPIPKSRKDVTHLDWHLQDPDLTNLLKAAEDGIKKVLFHDDNLVSYMQLAKRWCLPGREGVQVRVTMVDNADTKNRPDADKVVERMPGNAPSKVPAES